MTELEKNASVAQAVIHDGWHAPPLRMSGPKTGNTSPRPLVCVLGWTLNINKK